MSNDSLLKNVQRARDLGSLSPELDVFITSLPSKLFYSEEKVEKWKEPEMTDAFKEIASSRHNTANAHMHTLRLLTACPRPTQVQVRRNPSTEKGRCT